VQPAESTEHKHGEGVDHDHVRDIRARRIVPWLVSVLVHAVLILIACFVTWTVTWLQDDDDAGPISADFDAITYAPVQTMPLDPGEVTHEPTQPLLETTALDALSADLDAQLEEPSIEYLSTASSATAAAPRAPERLEAAGVFVGLEASNAKRIVYVIDASGSMIRSWPIVLDELVRSMRGLSEAQQFGVVFFQRNDAIVVPPGSRLRTGGAGRADEVRRWIDEHVIPRGRSNPMEAIDRALAFEPDVIFLLSENITGSGQFEIDQRDLLRLLDARNPVDPKTGRRPTQINCIQFLDPDPLRTLERIAEFHGGARGYTYRSREDLGLIAP